MHCDRCNIDFPEGLRYCKWCGEPLLDRPRVTSELHSCPSCSAAVQPGWAYCKACGEHLQVARKPTTACHQCGAPNEAGSVTCSRCSADLSAARAEQIAQDVIETSAIAKCGSCGDIMDTGSLYCKACGSAAYSSPANSEQVPFGGSAMLCGACNGYSPMGSKTCRVCGAVFPQAPRTVVDRPAPVPSVGEKPQTLRDLDEHLPETSPGSRELAAELQDDQVISGANTAVFASPEGAPSRPNLQTNLLPGTAGAKSEQQAPTSIMHMGRTTGPVEDEAPPEAAVIKPGKEAAPSILEKTIPAGLYEQAEPERPLQFSAERDTSGFGAETSDQPRGLETEVLASRPNEAAQTRVHLPKDEAVHSESAPSTWQSSGESTTQIPNGRNGVTADHLRPTGQIASAAQREGIEAKEPSGTLDLSAATGLHAHSAEAGAVSQPLPRRRTGVVITSLVVSLIVVVAAVYAAWWFAFSRGRPTSSVETPATIQTPATEVPVAPPVKPPVPVAPEGMVTVAAGTYTIGRDGADPLEQPQHPVDLPAFFIDRSEVTNADYRRFVEATGHQPPTNWRGGSFAEGHDSFPVTGVTWQDAADYAAWAGKRLPTEAEWEAAARGPDGRIYPWGNEWRVGLANIGANPDEIEADQYPSGIKEVGRYPEGASPVGAVDMIGNAWEWTADEFALYPGGLVEIPKAIKGRMKPGLTYRVIRGGAYDGNKTHDATYRGLLDADQAYPKVGFRCAKDAK